MTKVKTQDYPYDLIDISQYNVRQDNGSFYEDSFDKLKNQGASLNKVEKTKHPVGLGYFIGSDVYSGGILIVNMENESQFRIESYLLSKEDIIKIADSLAKVE